MTRMTTALLAVAGMVAMATAWTTAGNAQGGQWVIQRMNPPGLSTPTGYCPRRLGPRRPHGLHRWPGGARRQGHLVGEGDLAAQTRQVFANLETALKAAGASFNDVVKTNYYLRDASQVQVIRDVRGNVLHHGPAGQHAGRGLAARQPRLP